MRLPTNSETFEKALIELVIKMHQSDINIVKEDHFEGHME